LGLLQTVKLPALQGRYDSVKDVLQFFIEYAQKYGINPNYFITSDGYTPLMFAVRHDKSGKMVEELLDWGGIYMHRDDNGYSILLSMAIEAKNYNAVMQLCVSGNIVLNIADRVAVKKYIKSCSRPKVRSRSLSLE